MKCSAVQWPVPVAALLTSWITVTPSYFHFYKLSVYEVLLGLGHPVQDAQTFRIEITQLPEKGAGAVPASLPPLSYLSLCSLSPSLSISSLSPSLSPLLRPLVLLHRLAPPPAERRGGRASGKLEAAARAVV